MAEDSNPTLRVLEILNFLASQPEEQFTLAEIARRLGLSNGSAHRVLSALTAAQYLARHEGHKTYALGPAVVALGQAALEKHRGIEIARREIARLAVELNMQCSANVVADGELLVVVKEGMPRAHQGLTRVGERRPFMPPLGLCHVAWAGAQAQAAYLARAQGHLPAAVAARLEMALPVIRARGYAVAANGPARGQARVLAAGQGRDAAYWAGLFAQLEQITPDELQLLDLHEAGATGVSYLSAPVFSAVGAVTLQLVISGLPARVSPAALERYAARLCAAAAAITSETHGRQP